MSNLSTNTEYTTKNLSRVLGRKELLAMACGQIIGAGVMSMTGVAIGMTGRSVTIAFLIAAVLTVIQAIPYVLTCSVMRVRGGNYTQASLFVNEKFAGIYIIIFIMQNIIISIYALSFAQYFQTLIPSVNLKLIAVLFLTTFYVINLFGMKSAAKIQNIIVICLFISLFIFVVFGIPKVNWEAFTAAEGYFSGGPMGFLTASCFLTFACGGAFVITNFSGEAKNPKKDIPYAIIVSTIGVGVFFAVMSIVASGILPVEEVSFAPLSVVAKSFLSGPLYLFFVTFGALFAIATTINSVFGWVTKPILQACVDGWFPQKLAAVNKKYNTPHVILTLVWIIGLIPILTGFNIQKITQLTMILTSITNLILFVGFLRLPKLFPEQWKKSTYYMSNFLYNTLIIAAIIVAIFIFILLSLSDATIQVVIGNIVLFVAAYVYSTYRIKAKKVNMEVSYEEE